MTMDFAQVLSIVVAAGGAWLAGWLGVKRALGQAKQQRAFDRRLEWYEKAVRASMKFRQLAEEVTIAIKNDDLTTLERVKSRLQVTRSLQRTLNESLIFADKTTYIELKRVFKESQRRIAEMTQDLARSKLPSEDVHGAYEYMATLLERLSFDLATSIRMQLDLDEITIEEFEE
jgi:two-component sensor histidine kinase